MLHYKATAGCGVGFFVGVSVRKRTAPVALILGRVAVLPPPLATFPSPSSRRHSSQEFLHPCRRSRTSVIAESVLTVIAHARRPSRLATAICDYSASMSATPDGQT